MYCILTDIHSRVTITESVSTPTSLSEMNPCWLTSLLALAWQVKVVLSTVLSGFNVRVLVNDGLEPETDQMVTLASLLDKGMLPLNQMAKTETSISVATLMEMEQVRVRGAILPANSVPGGTVTTTSGVETKENMDNIIRGRGMS